MGTYVNGLNERSLVFGIRADADTRPLPSQRVQVRETVQKECVRCVDAGPLGPSITCTYKSTFKPGQAKVGKKRVASDKRRVNMFESEEERTFDRERNEGA